MLEVVGLRAGYGETRVLHGLSFSAKPGKVTAILGRNGAGKSTTLKTIMGLLPASEGGVAFDGAALVGRPPYEIAKLGVAYVPETRDIFPSLTVRENLEMSARRFGRPGGWTIPRVVEMFPRLGERMDNGGAQLSGGEQQMLTIARALLMNPRLLILDEPTEGLAPIIVKQLHGALKRLKADGLAMILVEQNFGFATSLADDVLVIGRGRVVWHGDAAGIRGDHEAQAKWLGV
jgi:branched-chain amino acid transport system ATP-binding protein